jgi:putative selenate reductase
MKVQPFDVLLKWILKEYELNRSIFGIHRSQFYIPKKDAVYAQPNYLGVALGTPIGPAAGPHTQLAQNIISSWLCGARFIELKTVQIMDELEIPRPCIDMEDEGYNVEWSQELKLGQSVSEYVKAWSLIHILNRLLGFENTAPLATVFNMSVGYNLEGIQSPAMTQFMDRMVDASEEIAQIKSYLQKNYPQFADLDIPSRLTNNVTLSTMHGCPPDEIERIANYLIEKRGLHTTVKLNPTLLGKERLLDILHNQLGFTDLFIPDSVFEHDLRYERALQLINALKSTAKKQGLVFGVKLSNTLAMSNHKHNLPGGEMYMSGRPLYPITMNLFHKLMVEFKGDLNVSYSAGADAFNVTNILASGARPVTVASDLLKPGGYARMRQYLENIESIMAKRGAHNLEELAKDKLNNLEKAAADSLTANRYKKHYQPYGLPKVQSGLDLFDCITAPCMEPCAVHQNIPEYAWLISQGQYDRALEVILSRNPLPGVTGYVCTHLCQTRCTQNNYEEPIAIRALKRVALENGVADLKVKQHSPTGKRVAVIGSGPSGLAAASFLALNGVQPVVFEAKDKPGGMLRMIPSFRLPDAIIQEDIERITGLGVEIKTSHPITQAPETLLEEGFDAVYIAAGFQKDMPLEIENGQASGVYAALDILERVRQGEKVNLGAKALIIGGGDTAMDAARIAKRLTGNPATILYRRTRQEMPASAEELEGALEEGTILEELITPKRVLLQDGKVVGLECLRNRLGEPDASGRRRPVVIEGSEFQVTADAVITAIGQLPDLHFLDKSSVSRAKNGSVKTEASGSAGAQHVYAGGDVVEGPDSIIAACRDGRIAAETICSELGVRFEEPPAQHPVLSEEDILQVKQARIRKESQYKPDMSPLEQRSSFELIESALQAEMAKAEASRCLQCTSFCDKCVEVCPNRANYTFNIAPVRWELPTLACQDGQLKVSSRQTYQVTQTRQIMHIDDFCNECGNCATFCVHNGKPYFEKPRLFFKEEDFVKEQENAYYIESTPSTWTIRHRNASLESSLVLGRTSAVFTFETPAVKLEINKDDFQIKSSQLKQTFAAPLTLTEAADMLVILDGLTSSMAYLPVL